MTLQDYGMLLGGALSGFVAGLVPRRRNGNGTSYITAAWAKGIEDDVSEVKDAVRRIETLLMEAGLPPRRSRTPQDET